MYGTGNAVVDGALPPCTGTDADSAVLVHHGTGHLGIEATAELAAQNGPDGAGETPRCPVP